LTFSKYKKEISRIAFKQFEATYNKFSQYRIFQDFIAQKSAELMQNNGWADKPILSEEILSNWLDYYPFNKDCIALKLENLVKNLDNESKYIANSIYKRNFFLFSRKIKIDIHKFNVMNIYSDFEKNEQTKFDLEKQNIWTEIVDYYSHGLFYLNQNILEYIKNKNFIDGGAFNGDSAIILNKYKPSKIYSFEPISINFEKLEKRIEKYNVSNIVKIAKLGLGASSGNLELYGEDENCSFIKPAKASKKETVEVVAIDDFCNKNDIKIGLIKLDVEGLEFDVIKGSLNTIKKDKPVLLISIYHTPDDFFEIKPLLEKETNYTFLIRPTSPYSLNTEFMLIGYPKELDLNE